MVRRRIIPFFITHAGCRHRCVFCNQETVAPPRPLQTIAEDITAVLSGISPEEPVECAFYGGTFAALPGQQRRMLLETVQPFRGRGLVTDIRISTRPDSLTPEIADELAAGGVGTVELGVQSLNDEVLRLSRRGHGAEDVELACSLLRSRGFAVGIQLMPGLPGDSTARSLESMERAIALAPDFLRIYPTLVLQGTELARLWRAGAYEPLSQEGAVDLCKRLLLMARRASIPVIRLGVQPSDMLDRAGTVLAGPYHPAFRQVVESALYGDLLLGMLPAAPAASRVRCNPHRVSDVVGQKRSNLKRAALLGHAVTVVPDELVPDGDLFLEAPGVRTHASLLRDAPY